MNVLYQQSIISLLFLFTMITSLNGQLLFENFENHTCPDLCDYDLNTVGCLPGWEHWYGSPSISNNANNNPVDGTNYLYFYYNVQPGFVITGEGAIANIPSGSSGDLLSLCFQLYYKGDHENLDNVVFSVYLANNVSGVNPPFGSCIDYPPGANGPNFQEIASIPASEVSGGWQTIFLPEIPAGINYNQLVFAPRTTNMNNILFLDYGVFMLDLVELEELESPFILPGVSLSSVDASWCDADEISVTYEVCSSVPVEIELTASSSAAGLIATPATQTVSLPNNGQNCIDVTFNYTELQEIDQGTAVTFSVELETSYLDAICDYSERSDFSHVYEKDCFPEFTCPCEGPNAINIDAGDINNGEALLISNSDLELLMENTIFGENTLVNTSSCLAIRGRLVIDGNYAIGGGEIRMQPGSEIVVQDGASLLLFGVDNNGGIHGCEEMWRGMRASTNGELTVWNNEIRDAQYAVFGEGGSGVTVWENNFINNYVGIYKPETTGPLLDYFQVQPFQDNSFIYNDQEVYLNAYIGQSPLPGSQSYAGAEIYNCTVVEFGAGNEFRSLLNGIITEGVGLSISDCNFNNIVGNFNPADFLVSPPNEGIGVRYDFGKFLLIQDCEFENMVRAIHAQSLNSVTNIADNIIGGVEDGIILNTSVINPTFRINGNEINYRQFGVFLADTPGNTTGTINDNRLTLGGIGTVYAESAGIRLSNAGSGFGGSIPLSLTNNNITLLDPGDGISIENSYNIFVESNPSIKFQGTIDHDDIKSGILVSNSQKIIVYNNTLEDAHNGTMETVGLNMRENSGAIICCNYTDGHNTGTRFIGMNSTTSYRQTDIRNHEIGLHCDAMTIIGSQLDAGNKWNGTYSDASARHLGVDFQVSLSVFEVLPPAGGSIYWPVGVDTPNSSNWFQDGGAAAKCALDQTCGNYYIPEQFDYFDTTIVLDSLFYHTLDSVYDWRAKQYLFTKINRTVSLQGINNVMEVFYTQMQNHAIGKLDSIQRGIHQLLDPEVDGVQGIWENQDHLEEHFDSLALLDSLLMFAATSADSSLLINQRIAKRSELEATLYNIDSLQNLADTIISIKAGQLMNYNQNISNDFLPVVNEKTVNRIYLESLLGSNTFFDSNQFQTLLAVANQCPNKGGQAVIWARTLLEKEQIRSFDDDNLCTNGLYFKSKTNILPSFQTEKLLIAPNPAKETAKVIWKNEAMANVLRIYRIDGSLVRTIPLMENNSFIELNVSLWPKGVYLLHLSFKDGTFETGRLVR